MRRPHCRPEYKWIYFDLPIIFSVPSDCQPHWRNWTFPHHKHYFWFWPLFLGQKYSEKTPKLPGNLWTILRPWAAGCWILPLFLLRIKTFDLVMWYKIASVAGSIGMCSLLVGIQPPTPLPPRERKKTTTTIHGWYCLHHIDQGVTGIRLVDQGITKKAL